MISFSRAHANDACSYAAGGREQPRTEQLSASTSPSERCALVRLERVCSLSVRPHGPLVMFV